MGGLYGPAKALELFLGMIVEEANKVTKDRGSKKVEAYHLYVSPPLSFCNFPSFQISAFCVHLRLSPFISPSFDLSVFGLPS